MFYFNNTLTPFIQKHQIISSNPQIQTIITQIKYNSSLSTLSNVFLSAIPSSKTPNPNQHRITLTYANPIKQASPPLQQQQPSQPPSTEVSTTSSTSSSSNEHDEKISAYCSIKETSTPKTKRNPFTYPYEEEREVKGENIIYITNQKVSSSSSSTSHNKIKLISINLFLKKIFFDASFTTTYSDLITSFISQHSAFVSTDLLLDKVIAAFNHHHKSSSYLSLNMQNIISFTKTIIIHNYNSISPSIKSKLITLYNKLSKTRLVSSLISLLENDYDEHELSYLEHFSEPLPHSSINIYVRDTNINRFSNNEQFNIFDWDEHSIADQLSHITLTYLSNIKPCEIFSAKFAKKQKEQTSPNIIKLIKRFDELCGFIVEEILSYDDEKVRALVIEKWITIAECLKLKNNFNDCMNVISALMSYILKKLKLTWTHVREEYMKKFVEMKKFCSCEKNYLNINKAIEYCVNKEQAFIPYLGILLKEIFNIEEKHQYIKEDVLINCEKIMDVARVIKKFYQFQETNYVCLPNECLAFLGNLKPSKDNELEDICKKLEPTFILASTKASNKRCSRTDKENFPVKKRKWGFYINVKQKQFEIKDNYFIN